MNSMLYTTAATISAHRRHRKNSQSLAGLVMPPSRNRMSNSS